MATFRNSGGHLSGSAAAGRPRLPRIFWAALVVLAALVALWLVSVLALPSLQRAAVESNEASAIGYIRAVAAAHKQAVALNRGFSLPLACLSDPAQCPPAVSSAPLLSASLPGSYASFFTVSSSPGPEEIAEKGPVARSITTWVLVVLPRQPGVTGRRVFCTDAGGDLFFTPDVNTLPDTSRGRCGDTYQLK